MDNHQEVLNQYAFQQYRKEAVEMMSLLYPNLSYEQILYSVNQSMLKRFKDHKVQIVNNYKKQTVDESLSGALNYMETKKPILTTYGVMFRRHGEGEPNLLVDSILGYIRDRKKIKAKMKDYEVGSPMYNKLNMDQTLKKLSANKSYGILGKETSTIYNPYLGGATTQQAKACICVSILFFEAFLTNNVQFGSLEQVINYIYNIRSEPHKYTDEVEDHLFDTEVNDLMVMTQIVDTCGYDNWVPTDAELDIIYNTICRVDKRTLRKLYYKNNLLAFCNNSKVKKALVDILRSMTCTFINPNTPEEAIKPKLDVFMDLLREYVYYPFMYIDKLDRVKTMQKNVCVYTHTDSSIVCLDFWYRYVLDIVKDIDDIPIKNEYFKKSDAVNGIATVTRTAEYQIYDVYNDEFMTKERELYPEEINPMDNLRYSIINIMSYVLSNLSREYLIRFSESYNALAGDKCLMQLKNEFLMKRMFIYPMRKTYCALIERIENNIVPESKQPKYTGVKMAENGVSEATSEQLTTLLEDKVLKAPQINQNEILAGIIKIKKNIHNSIANKSKEFYKPMKLKSMSSYKLPMRMTQVKGSLVYNAIKEEEDIPIKMTERSYVDIVNVKINKDTIEKVKDKNPGLYSRCLSVLQDKEIMGSNKEITSIALPKEQEVPDWVLEFVDYDKIIFNSVHLFPIEYLGMSLGGNKNSIGSNIINI